MDASPLRVVIAEDSALIREGISRLIEESGGSVVAKVGDTSTPRSRPEGITASGCT